MIDPNTTSSATATTSTPMVQIYGRLGSANGWAIRDFLTRCGIPFEWIQLENDEQARALLGVQSLTDARLPVCVFGDGTRMECPNIRQIIEKLGWFTSPTRTEYDLAIYGAGPAGLSAAVYASSDGLKTVVVERGAIGGQAASSSRIENYLGFPQGISGSELAKRAHEQACKFGSEILLARKGVAAEFQPGKGTGILEDGTRIVARASICATGVEYRRLGLPEEERFLGAGVYYGAGASEAALTRGEHVFIVGGGNSGAQAAMHFAPHARRVSIVIRGESLKSTVSQYLIDRIRNTANIEVIPNTEVVALRGGAVLEEITLAYRRTGQQHTARTRWLFVCLGGVPQTEWAEDVGMARDAGGYLVTGPDLLRGGTRPARWPLDRDPYYLETCIPGVFAAGDVRHGSVKRCATAVGEGAMAVALVHHYLANG